MISPISGSAAAATSSGGRGSRRRLAFDCLIAPQLVKPYVKRGKNDTADAKALCEAMSSTDDALRAGEDCRTTSGPDDGRLARSADPQSHPAVERHPRLCGRVRLYLRQGDGAHRSAARSHSS